MSFAASVLGKSQTLSASATAGLSVPLNTSCNFIPLSVLIDDDTTKLVPGQTYTIRAGTGNSPSPGNYQILAIAGRGGVDVGYGIGAGVDACAKAGKIYSVDRRKPRGRTARAACPAESRSITSPPGVISRNDLAPEPHIDRLRFDESAEPESEQHPAVNAVRAACRGRSCRTGCGRGCGLWRVRVQLVDRHRVFQNVIEQPQVSQARPARNTGAARPRRSVRRPAHASISVTCAHRAQGGTRWWRRPPRTRRSRRETDAAWGDPREGRLTTETQRHREDKRRSSSNNSFSCLLCVSVSLWLVLGYDTHNSSPPPQGNLIMPRLRFLLASRCSCRRSRPSPSTRPSPRRRSPRRSRTRLELHGDIRVDDYFWLKDKTNPEVIKYLEAENAYTAAVIKPHRAVPGDALQGDPRPHQADRPGVPVRDRGYWYYTRTDEGQAVPDLLPQEGHPRRARGGPARRQRAGQGREVLQRRPARASATTATCSPTPPTPPASASTSCRSRTCAPASCSRTSW